MTTLGIANSASDDDEDVAVPLPDASADDDGLHDVFEIVDYSTASSWEKAIDDVEKAFREWNIRPITDDDLQPHQLPRCAPIDIALAGRTYRVSYSTTAHASPVPVSARQTRQLDTAFHGDIPGVLKWMVSSNFDFHPTTHIIHSRLGLPAFVLIEAVGNQYSDKVSTSEAKMLLGTLSIAAGNAGLTIPLFAQIHEARLGTYLGRCGGIGWTVAMDGTHLHVVPKHCSNIAGLLRMFRSKAMLPHTAKSFVSVKFTYSYPNLFQDWAVSSAGTVADAKKKGTATAKSKGAASRFLHPLRLPFGLKKESLQSINLACVWPHFREDVLLDTSEHSELSPTSAPTWSLLVNKIDDHPQGRLERVLRGFALLAKMRVKIRSVLGDTAYMDSDDVGSKPVSGRDVLNSLAQPSSVLSDDIIRKGKDFGARINSVVEQTVRKVRAREDGRGNLTSEEMDQILGHLFINTATWSEALADKFSTEKCKSAPKQGLLYVLAQYLAAVCSFCGGTPAAAFLWSEFVMEIRWHWENLKPLPRLAAAAQPNMNQCLLQQKLELINCCIERQLHHNTIRQRESTSSADGSKRAGAHSSRGTTNDNEAANDAEAAVKDKEVSYGNKDDDDDDDGGHDDDDDDENDSDNGVGDDDDDDDNDDDDEFYLCPEDEEGAMQRLQALKLRAQSHPEKFEERAETEATPRGVKHDHPTLKLLAGDVLRVPMTQEMGPMTEDMLHARLEELSEMGDSEEAARARTEIQSIALKSDVQAFKAANPSAVLADFIRWHSPRDWVVVNEETGECGLSSRMRDPTNIWHRLWDSSIPMPVSKQRKLFDTTTEVEKALRYMEDMSFEDLGQQLFPSLFEHAYSLAEEHVLGEAGTPEFLREDLASLRYLTKGMGISLEDDTDRMEEMISRLARVEYGSGVFSALVGQLGPETASLCSELTENGRCVVLEEDHRAKVLAYFADTHPDLMANGSGDLPNLHQREFIFRAAHDESVARMYVLLNEHELEIAGAFTTSKLL